MIELWISHVRQILDRRWAEGLPEHENRHQDLGRCPGILYHGRDHQRLWCMPSEMNEQNTRPQEAAYTDDLGVLRH